MISNSPDLSNAIKSREDICHLITQICEPIKPYYSSGFARIKLGNTGAAYADSTAEMEGFSRVLWGLIPLMKHANQRYELWDMHLEGIKNGTNPDHEEYWGDIGPYDQRMVEMAAFGLALLLIPEKVWDPLNEVEKRNFSQWLNQINQYQVWDCNWLFFPVLVNLGLKHVGLPYDEEKVTVNLERIDQFYLSNGWYLDGVNGHSDYYTPFAIHYYSLIYAKVMEQEDPERSHQYKVRAEQFAKEFIYWFSEDGSALPYGRSLTYRFAQSAFWSAAVFAGITPFSLGEMKGIILRNLRWWFQQLILDENGILTIGYSYPNLIMAENYNSPGSPYWGLKTFLFLALEEENSFWSVEEEPLPTLASKVIQKEPHFVICRNENCGDIVAFNSGHTATNEHTHTSAKYEKFAYSTKFGFSVPRAEWGLSQGAYDSMLALSEGDNIYRVKRWSEDYIVEENYLYTKWKPWKDVEVKTWIIPGTPWHIRIHNIKTNRELDAAEGGFALGIEDDNISENSINEASCLTKNSVDMSGIRSLEGYSQAELIYAQSNTNLLHARTIIPTLKTEIQPGKHWLASAIYGDGVSHSDKNGWNSAPTVTISNEKITCSFQGELPIEIPLT